MTAVGDQSHCAVEKSGKNHSAADLNLCLVLQDFAAPYTFA